jgi:hypothetical protein
MDYSFGFWFFATLAAIAVGLGKGGDMPFSISFSPF